MGSDEERREDDFPFSRPRKRGRYTQVACNECKRRKLKCSGGAVCARCTRDSISCIYATSRVVTTSQDTGEVNDEREESRFHTVNSQLENLQREMRTLSARLQQLESGSPAAPSKSFTSTQAAGGLNRILNPPKSPSYVGPTSAEFGLGQPREAHSIENRDDNHTADEEDGHACLCTTETLCPLIPVGTLPTEDPWKILGLEETLRLVQIYEDTVGIMYPCVDLASLRTYVVEYYHSRQKNGQTTDPVSASDQDWFHARDIQILKIVLATALLVESHGQSESAAQLADSVEDRFASRLKIAQVDMKEILILTLLSIFHSYRDDEVIAWRLTGMAARGSMELGLHRQETWQKTGGVFPGALEWMWASRLFWCIYVLDRKWSFGTGLPFAIQDSDMDTNLPEPGHSTPYLTCMISYARLSAKIWGLVVGWSDRSRQATSERCIFLDAQVREWVDSIPSELRFDPSWHPPRGSEHADRDMMLQVLLALQANQLRILVYRQNLLSGDRIADDIDGASTAVETAKRTVQILDYFSRVSDVYFQRPEPFNYFLISALAAFFLAVLHAPAHFSQTCRPEFYTAVNMARRSATRARTSRRLQKIIHSLKRIQLNVQWQPQRGLSQASSQPFSHTAGALVADGFLRRETQDKRLDSHVMWNTTPLSSSLESPSIHKTPSLYQPSGVPTPQPSSAFWSLSPRAAVETNSNGCEDLSSFFEIAGGLYFDPQAGTGLAGGVQMGMSHSENGRIPNALDAFQAEDEALTRVMAGLL